MAQTVKKPSATRETWVQSLVQEEPLEKGVATHSRILTWRVPWREEPGGLQSMHMCMLSRFSRVQLFVTPWTVTGQAPLSMGFSGQEYWSGLPCPPPGGLPDPGLNLDLLHCKHILYSLSHQGSPRSLKIMFVSHFVLAGWP